jgi:transposase, IS6 family
VPSQYTSIAFTERLATIGVSPSIGTVGDAYDNALAETVVGLYKTELIHPQRPWKTLEEVEIATLHPSTGSTTPGSTRRTETSRRSSSSRPTTVNTGPQPEARSHQTALLRWLIPGARETGAVMRLRSGSSAPAGYRFPREVIAIAVRWYLRYGLSYRDVEELLAERGITVDHVTVYRWVQTFTPEFIDAARPARRAAGDRWFVNETYVKVAGRWSYLYRAVDQYGQVIDVLVSTRSDAAAARHFFTRALGCGPAPVEVVTDRAPVYPRVLDELVPAARHVTDRYQNNVVEADHGRLKARLRPMRGLKRLRSARIISAGHAFVQNLRRGHYTLTTEHSPPTCQSMIASASRSMSSRYCSDLVENLRRMRFRQPDLHQRNSAAHGNRGGRSRGGCGVA